MPVRVKQRPADETASKLRDKDWSLVCQTVTGMILAVGRPISLTMKASDEDHVYRNKTLPKIHSDLSQAARKISFPSSFEPALIQSVLAQGTSLDAATCEGWIKTSARTGSITVRALISPKPAPSKQSQFISLADRFMPSHDGCGMLYDTINDLFSNSSFAVQEAPQGAQAKDVWMTTKQLRGAGKGVDRWPMFYIRVDVSAQQLQQRLSSNSRTKGRLPEILDVITTMILSFLTAHYFRPRNRRNADGRDPSNKSLSPLKRVHTPTGFDQKDARDMTPASDLRKEHIPITSHPKRPKILGDLEIAVNFPTAKKHDLANSISGNTLPSRIKTSALYDRDVVPNRSDHQDHQANLKDDPAFKVQEHKCDRQSSSKLINVQSPSHIGCKDGREATAIESLGNKDPIIRWTHPITKQILHLNARTGCEVSPTTDLRPTSTDDRLMHMAMSRRQTSLPKRIVRTSSGFALPEEGSWASTFFDKWENPVFQRSEEAITRITNEVSDDVHCAPSGRNGFNLQQAGQNFVLPFHSRVSKPDLEHAIVISQIDSKFILIKTRAGSPSQAKSVNDMECSKLVLVDQHAADERVQVEALLEELCRPISDETRAFLSPLGFRSEVETTSLQRPILFDLQHREYAIFRRHAGHFARWGVIYDLVSNLTGPSIVEAKEFCRLSVLTLPPGIAERCRVEPKLLIEMLRGEAWNLEGSSRSGSGSVWTPTSSTQKESGRSPLWVQRIASCPKEILDMLNSRSCRSAIMFNDDLSKQQCEDLIKKLAKCQFPFQCAHGRPSMVPIVNLAGSDASDLLNKGFSGTAVKEVNFREAWRDWGSGSS